MDITTFYNITPTETKDDNSIIKKIFGELANTKSISLKDYEYCINYIDNGMMLKNGKCFDDIIKTLQQNKKIGKLSHMNDILQPRDCIKLVKQMEEEREKIISFNDERKNAIRKIFNVLYDPQINLFGMYGYAGTGKTTLIMEIVQFLALHKLIKSVVFSAPTHKALNVMKTNFSKLLTNLIKVFNIIDQKSFENNLDELKAHGITVEFMTIHKLLGYSADFNDKGCKVFVKKVKTTKSTVTSDFENTTNKYDLIIIDECSMISLQMIIELFSEIRKQQRNVECNKIPKIIFTGDPAQLPPVNEVSSSIFTKAKEEITFTEYLKYVNVYGSFVTQEILKTNYTQLIEDLMKMETITLKQIFRNTRSNVLDLCYNIRQWVSGEISKPNIGKYNGNGVFLYSSKTNKIKSGQKICSQWFQRCIDSFTDGRLSNIILTWTNARSDLYNEMIRKILLNKEEIGTFEIGDVLILNDFYWFNDKTNEKQKQLNDEDELSDVDNRFYTSEQLKILDLSIVDMRVNELVENIPKSIKNLKDSPDIVKKYRMSLHKINNMTKKIYTSWKMKVSRLGEFTTSKTIDKKDYTMYVIHESSAKQLASDNESVIKIIRILLQNYQTQNSSQFKTIEKYLLKPLWKYWNDNFVAPFANVVFGYSITTHKAQGSTFDNVFIDADDILNNSNENEAKRCIYTAHTRCANEIHILI